MLVKDELTQLSISELKKMAKELNVQYDKNVKKEELINLLLKVDKINELEKEKKQDLQNNPTSQSSSQSYRTEERVDNNNIPELPKSYEKDNIVFMVRDPYWGFVYWNITEKLLKENNLYDVDKFLRVYDITNSSNPDNPDSFFDIKITNGANNWYVKFPMANRTFVIDYGYFKDGEFKTLLRSNIVKTPRDNVSDQIDEEWMLTDEQFNLMMKASGADQLFQQIGSQELIKFLAGNLNEEISSNPGNSPSSPFSPF